MWFTHSVGVAECSQGGNGRLHLPEVLVQPGPTLEEMVDSSKALVFLHEVKQRVYKGREEGARGEMRVGKGEGREHTLVGSMAGRLEVEGGETVLAKGPAKHCSNLFRLI